MENYFCVYPIYIDSTKSMSEGRKYKKEMCIPNPKYQEILSALKKLDIEHIDEPGKRHPRDIFNSGRFKIKKEYGKTFVIEGISQMITEFRSTGARSAVGEKGVDESKKGKVMQGIVQNGVYVENKLNLVRKKKSKKGK